MRIATGLLATTVLERPIDASSLFGDPYRVNVTTGVSERYGAVLFPRKS
jgi:hypothetical protein